MAKTVVILCRKISIHFRCIIAVMERRTHIRPQFSRYVYTFIWQMRLLDTF